MFALSITILLKLNIKFNIESMVLKIFGGFLAVVGLFLLIGAPGDRAQIVAYGNTGRLVGLIMMIIGILMVVL
jgi:hypothetical protein